MSQPRLWTQYQQKILKYIRDEQGIQKWSTIAQKMADQYGIKGRNGKQCKQHYMEVFDQNNEVLHWDYASEQMMFSLHQKLGNKWAAIGLQLNNRTDNDVKNHFYSKIRKGLRKINYVIKDHFRKQIKEIKQTVLYKIIEGAEDRFNPNPIYDQDIWRYCSETKHYLLRMSYDQQEYNPWQNFKKHSNQIKQFIQDLFHFSKDFQRKPKQYSKKNQETHQSESQGLKMSVKFEKRASSNQNNNGQSIICDSEIQSSQIDDSQSPETQKTPKNGKEMQQKDQPNFKTVIKQTKLFQSPSIIPRKQQKVNQVIILKSSNDLNEIIMQQKSSIDLSKKPQQKSEKSPKSSKPTQSLLPSIPKLIHISSKANAMIDQEDQFTHHNKQWSQKDIQLELMKDGLLEQQEEQKNSHQICLFNGSGSKKIASKGSNFSSYSMDEQPFFGQDSTLNMRIFTTGVGGKMHHEMNQSIEKSDKLFKSLQRSGKLFESNSSKGMMDLQMSIERSGDLKKSSFLAQSVGK